MFSFLNKIRRSLIISGHVQKYLLYAVGEIALVVAGILIALQVNNWNEQKKDIIELTKIKGDLLNEFVENREVLKDRIDLIEKSLIHSNSVIDYMGAERATISQVNMDSILVYTMYYGNFNPSNSTITELLQSSGLKLSSDDTLKIHLVKWMQLLEDTDEDFKNQDLNANQYLMPYLTKRISQRNIDAEGLYGVTSGKSQLISDYYYRIFQDFEFENLMITHMVWHTIMVKHYRELDSLALDIIDRLTF